jgi:competence protein ComEC
MPGGYDFSYTLFYQRIGALGFAFGGATPAAIGPPPLSIHVAEPLAHLRDRLRQRVEDALPGDYGHIAAALIMGDQRGIDRDTQDAMRASGLGHILSISGLHLALVLLALLAAACARGAVANARPELSDQEMGGDGGACRRHDLPRHIGL